MAKRKRKTSRKSSASSARTSTRTTDAREQRFLLWFAVALIVLAAYLFLNQ